MSIAKLTHHSLERMTSREDAPRIYAAVLQKPDFSHPNYAQDRPIIKQVCLRGLSCKGDDHAELLLLS